LICAVDILKRQTILSKFKAHSSVSTKPSVRMGSMATSTSCYHLPNGKPKTVIVTGGANGIGARTARTYLDHGCNIVIADLPSSSEAASALISSLPEPSRAAYHPTNIVRWSDVQGLFRETKKAFGQVDIVVANAGLMESKAFFDFEEDEQGELMEATEASNIIDVNLKGTMNSELPVLTHFIQFHL
jgi:NADP-dependent 3-hydroxy acid dehydrogenase YdfG